MRQIGEFLRLQLSFAVYQRVALRHEVRYGFRSLVSAETMIYLVSLQVVSHGFVVPFQVFEN